MTNTKASRAEAQVLRFILILISLPVFLTIGGAVLLILAIPVTLAVAVWMVYLMFPGRQCPQCEASGRTITTRTFHHVFPYGDPPLMLDVIVPLHTCSDCEFSFFGKEGEKLKEQAIRAYRRGRPWHKRTP